jgi:hypothetical protein
MHVMGEGSYARPPELPARETIPEDELDAFDYMLTRVRGAEQAQITTVGGEAYGAAYFRAMAGSPALGAALSQLGSLSMEVPGRPGTLSAGDHELIDAILAFDSGYTFLFAGHGPLAVHAGVRPEALAAIRDAREGDLTDDERRQVEFVRAVRDGKVTDEIWASMAERLGSERGAIEYAFFVCLVLFHHLFAWALGVPDMTRDELDGMFRSFTATDVGYSDYVKLFGTKPFEVRT